ncbi:MAG TPA: riboflavin synthase [Actinomycetota bacterium]|nr:riboflavin synthase [Actinomycetota bacterium]
MFTGIVEERGSVIRSGPTPAGHRLEIACRTVGEDARAGDSIAAGGVCLTVVQAGDGALAFDLSPETLDRTTLGSLRPGDRVNLERPVTVATRLGGHVVQGHVDGVGTVVSREDDPAGGAVVRVRVPAGIERYLVEKGSVAVDGVSLTVAAADGDAFTAALIPHTVAVTTLGAAGPGTRVNLEVDVLAKYVERLAGRSA